MGNNFYHTDLAGNNFYHTDLAGVLDTVVSVAEASKYIIEDPYLPAAANRIKTLHDLAAKSAPSGSPASKGIGLNKIVPLLDAYIFYRKNPWIILAGVVGVVGLIKILK